MVVEDPHLVDAGSTGADGGLGAFDVLAILAAARVRAVRRQDDSQARLTPWPVICGQRIGQHRVPVAVSPVNRQAESRAARARAAGRRSARGPGR